MTDAAMEPDERSNVGPGARSSRRGYARMCRYLASPKGTAVTLGIRLGEALAERNLGGRITRAIIRDIAYAAYLVETKAPDGPYFEVAINHHTDCGSTLLADDDLRHGFAQRAGVDERTLADTPRPGSGPHRPDRRSASAMGSGDIAGCPGLRSRLRRPDGLRNHCRRYEIEDAVGTPAELKMAGSVCKATWSAARGGGCVGRAEYDRGQATVLVEQAQQEDHDPRDHADACDRRRVRGRSARMRGDGCRGRPGRQVRR
jgi:hypothetical protein